MPRKRTHTIAVREDAGKRDRRGTEQHHSDGSQGQGSSVDSGGSVSNPSQSSDGLLGQNGEFVDRQQRRARKRSRSTMEQQGAELVQGVGLSHVHGTRRPSAAAEVSGHVAKRVRVGGIGALSRGPQEQDVAIPEPKEPRRWQRSAEVDQTVLPPAIQALPKHTHPRVLEELGRIEQLNPFIDKIKAALDKSQKGSGPRTFAERKKEQKKQQEQLLRDTAPDKAHKDWNEARSEADKKAEEEAEKVFTKLANTPVAGVDPSSAIDGSGSGGGGAPPLTTSSAEAESDTLDQGMRILAVLGWSKQEMEYTRRQAQQQQLLHLQQQQQQQKGQEQAHGQSDDSEPAWSTSSSAPASSFTEPSQGAGGAGHQSAAAAGRLAAAASSSAGLSGAGSWGAAEAQVEEEEEEDDDDGTIPPWQAVMTAPKDEEPPDWQRDEKADTGELGRKLALPAGGLRSPRTRSPSRSRSRSGSRSRSRSNSASSPSARSSPANAAAGPRAGASMRPVTSSSSSPSSESPTHEALSTSVDTGKDKSKSTGATAHASQDAAAGADAAAGPAGQGGGAGRDGAAGGSGQGAAEPQPGSRRSSRATRRSSRAKGSR